MMVLYPEDSGSSTTKSILRVFHWASGIGIKWSSLTGGFLEGFVQR